MEFDGGKRYRSFVGYYREKYGERLQKIVLDAGFTCPNRDGTVGRGGCTYCDNAAFHPGYSTPGKTLRQQTDEGIEFHRVRYRNAGHYLAYFQSYSNTYAPVERLREQCRHLAVVSCEVCAGGRDYAPGAEGYLRLLADAHRALAARADNVCEVACGLPCYYKGEDV